MTNPYESYYVTKHSDLNAKTRNLLSSKGWRREILDVLLQEDEDKAASDRVNHILSTVLPVTDKRYNFFIELLPKNIRGKASMLMHYINNVVRVTDEGIVEYDDGSFGSNIIDLLKYFCSSGSIVVKKPFDADRLEQLLKDIGAPLSAFGKRSSVRSESLPTWRNRK